MRGAGGVTDLYGVLGVESSATDVMITSAFRARVRELRPDIRLDAQTVQRFGRLRDAYDTLRDPRLRAAYDRERETACPAAVRPPYRVAVVRAASGPPRPAPPLRAGPVRRERRA